MERPNSEHQAQERSGTVGQLEYAPVRGDVLQEGSALCVAVKSVCLRVQHEFGGMQRGSLTSVVVGVQHLTAGQEDPAGGIGASQGPL
jgi:hypothetical protein